MHTGLYDFGPQGRYLSCALELRSLTNKFYSKNGVNGVKGFRYLGFVTSVHSDVIKYST